MKRWDMLAIAAFMTGMLIPMAGQPRPREWQVNDMLISDSGTVRSLGLTVEDMEALTYGVDEIPGYECLPNPYTDNHTIIGLNCNGDKPTGWLRSLILRGWTNLTTGDLLRVEVRVYGKAAGEYERYERLPQRKITPASIKIINVFNWRIKAHLTSQKSKATAAKNQR